MIIKNQSTLFKRIVRPYFLMLFIIMSAVLFMCYFTAVDKIKNSTTQSCVQLAEKTARQTDAYIGELDLLSEQVKHSTKIINFFYNLRNNNDNTNHFDTDVLNNINISSELKNLIVMRAADYNITLYNRLGDFVCSQEYMTNKSGIKSTLTPAYYDDLIAQLNENGDVLILPPAKNPWTNSSEMYITMVKTLRNNYSDSICGLIEVRCSVRKFAADTGITYDGSAIIRKSDNKVIFPINHSANLTDEGYIRASLNNADWEVALFAPPAAKNAFNMPLILMFAALYILMIFFAFALANTIGRFVTKPITELAQYVKTINSPNASLKHFDNGAIDEIKELGDSFEKMLARMNNSIIQEKKAYAVALQAQMNPHFLYNTLSVIGAAGSEAGCSNVSDMCIKLSDMLRYVAAYQEITVPLKEEITHTRNYLSLMKSRYEDFFTYTMDIDEELMNIPFPKLFIQPLAENCFMHGFKKTSPPWNIDIKMKGTKDRWELVVKDNGSGIAEERMIEIKNKISNALSDTVMGDIGGVGIVNTIVRLKMTHNKNLRYDIYNDNGMIIKIVAGE